MKVKLPETIETDRLLLKKHSLDPSYIQLWVDSINQNLGWFEHFLPFDGPVTFEKEKTFLEDVLTEKKEIAYSLWIKKTNELIGSIGAFNYEECNKKSSIEIGYMLFEKFAGNGYGPEAMENLKKELFSQGVDNIIAKIDERNVRSRRAAEKIGFKWNGKETVPSNKKLLIYRLKRGSR